MKETPLLSVCIPIWNDEVYVGEALSSILNQTYKNIEVIFSNNASDDRSIEIINSFNDPRVKVYTNEKNMGGMYNFRKVFTYATGKYMTYLGADDALEPDTYEKAIKILEDEKNQDINLVNTYIEVINDLGEHVLTKKYIFGKGRISSYWAIRSNFIYGSNMIGEPNGSVWRRETFEQLGEPKFFNSNGWTADLDLKMELLIRSKYTYMIPEPLGKFRVSADSGSITTPRAKLFREYAHTIYRDKRYKLSYGWVIFASISSASLDLVRRVIYKVFIKKK